MEDFLAVGTDVVVGEEETPEGEEDSDAEEDVGWFVEGGFVYPWLGNLGLWPRS